MPRHQIIRLVIILGGCLVAAPALAQLSGLINPLGFIAYYESTYDPTATSNSSSATGLFANINSTWAQALQDCGGQCGPLAQYPTAASAPASVQIAANAALINTNGLSDWLCNGCDPAFAALVAQAGGASAFATSGLSSNPNDYLGANANPSAYLSANNFVSGTVAQANGLLPPTAGGGNGITVTAANGNGSIGSAASAAGVAGTGNTSNTVSPFTYVWNVYQSAVLPAITNTTQTAVNTAAPYVLVLGTIMVMVMGAQVFLGRMDGQIFLVRVVKFAIAAMLATNITIYQNYVVGMFNGLATLGSQMFTGTNSTNPAGGFDVLWHSIWQYVTTVSWGLPWGVASVFVDGLIVVISAFIIGIFDLLLFLLWFGEIVCLQILLVFGPILALGLLFEYSSRWFFGWINENVGTVLSLAAAYLMIGIILNMVNAAFQAAPAGVTPAQAAANLAGTAVITVIFALSGYILFRKFASLANATAASYGGAVAGTAAAARSAGRAVTAFFV
jgi:TrbL/VirB6 plasmid conjugal transfer protein